MNRLLSHPYRTFDHIRCTCDRTLPLDTPLWSRAVFDCPRLKTYGYMQRNNAFPAFMPWLVNSCKVTCNRCDLTIKGFEERCLLIEVNEQIMEAVRVVHSHEFKGDYKIRFEMSNDKTDNISPVVHNTVIPHLDFKKET